MQIQKINPFLNYNFKQTAKITKKEDPIEEQPQYSSMPSSLAFGARVDKGLSRFYEVNADKMPSTVKKFIENLPSKEIFTPLAAQAAAFAGLAGALTISDIKNSYPEEELFQNLISPDDSKATRGILGTYRENKDLLEMCDQGILENKENLTVWLIKKIFLEGKTVDEINQDLDKDISPDFKKLYTEKEPDGQAIRGTTLKALGIKMPAFEYMQSLRYTRDGYSDAVGEKISQVQRAFWDSMPPEERTARARASVLRFENWWASMSYDEKLDVIAEQMDTIELLKKFNSSDLGKTKSHSKPKTVQAKNPQTHTSQPSSVLSRDDLFKIWAANNLKIFNENLSPLDRERIQVKRTQRRVEGWETMTPEEQTEYLAKLKTGTEPLRYAMIDAWNNNPEILVELSLFFKRKSIQNPEEDLYNDKNFSDKMSNLMSAFWSENPDFAAQLGREISNSHQKIKTAINSGNFEILKRDILKAKTLRQKETAKEVKEYMQIDPLGIMENYPPYMKNFMKLYKNIFPDKGEFLPKEYFMDFFNAAYSDLTEDQINSWTKFIVKDKLTPEDIMNIENIRCSETPKATIMNRALEAALADALYKCTDNPIVFTMSQADCKIALSQVLAGANEIDILSEKLDHRFKITVKNRNVDFERITGVYNDTRAPLSNMEADEILEQYFVISKSKENDIEEVKRIRNELNNYITLYGRSIYTAFSTKSLYPAEVRKAFVEKFLYNLPASLLDGGFTLRVKTIEDFNREDQINRINNAFSRKYSFVPQEAMESYLLELDKALRMTGTLNEFEKYCCKKKKAPEEPSVAFTLTRDQFTVVDYLLNLCLEQSMADVLYKATGEAKVYSLAAEELMEELESFSLVKRLPFAKTVQSRERGENFEVRLKSKPNLFQLKQLYADYMKEILEYVNECYEEGKRIQKEDLVLILNPDENKTDVDEYTRNRIVEFPA